MLRDRLIGVVCLGAATVAATWGGNGILHRAEALAARGASPAAHADALGAGPVGADPAPAPSPDPAPTVTSAPPSSTTTAPASTTTTTAPAGEPPAELVKRGLLAPTDVPAGFTVTTPAPPEGSAASDSPFERCLGPDAGSLTAVIGARARSATFAKADTGSVSSLAVVVDQPASAEKILGLLTTTAARQCFEGLINARLARNPKLSQDVRGSLGPAPSPALGDGAVAYRFEVRLPAEDVDATARPDDPPIRFVADFYLIRKGRTLVLAEFDNLRQPWMDSTLKAVAANLVAHI